MDIESFFNGTAFDAYDYFGAHPTGNGVVFRVYAPNAGKVAVKGDFNGWYPQQMFCDCGIWSVEIPEARPGHYYKYVIYTRGGDVKEHCDPYGFGMEMRPGWSSVVRDLNEFRFTDDEWIYFRDKNYDKPLNIYEMHLGGWKENPDYDPEKDPADKRFMTYDKIADLLIPYLKENGFTHVEVMPLSEHPADISWGYQNTGFYSPTSRYGTAAQLMEMINKLHNAGIGAIMDFVPVHFALDDYALLNFDGTPLYEYPESDVAVSEWGTCNFLFNRPHTSVFMQSCADYWLTKYHFDGLRMDAISRAIYWMGDQNRGVNPNSLEFLKQMNGGLQIRHGDCMLIAEDSTAYPKITVPTQYGGLGFDYKWDLGWMNDTLNYFRTPPIERKAHHHKLTFSMQYFYSEHFIVEFSHDENVHSKATVINKMWGDYEDKFPQARAMYMYMYTHPGKKLNFMGGENGQFREFDETRGQDWDILKYPLHESFNRYFKRLTGLYISEPALHCAEYDPKSFRWLMADNADQNFYAYERSAGGERILCAFNFSGSEQTVAFDIGENAVLEPLLHSDEQTWSGTVRHEDIIPITAENGRHIIKLPRFSGEMFKIKE